MIHEENINFIVRDWRAITRLSLKRTFLKNLKEALPFLVYIKIWFYFICKDIRKLITFNEFLSRVTLITRFCSVGNTVILFNLTYCVTFKSLSTIRSTLCSFQPLILHIFFCDLKTLFQTGSIIYYIRKQ